MAIIDENGIRWVNIIPARRIKRKGKRKNYTYEHIKKTNIVGFIENGLDHYLDTLEMVPSGLVFEMREFYEEEMNNV
jgi:hypothetical protein